MWTLLCKFCYWCYLLEHVTSITNCPACMPVNESFLLVISTYHSLSILDTDLHSHMIDIRKNITADYLNNCSQSKNGVTRALSNFPFVERTSDSR
jgi:hypothetical protein